MKTLMNICAVLMLTTLFACGHTLEGIGKDLQELGKSIEDSNKE